MENTKTDSKILTPYLFFYGRCEEAIELYKKAFGAEVEFLMKFNESPEPIPEGILAPGFEDKVMHGSIKIAGFDVFVSDGSQAGKKVDGFCLHVPVDTKEEVDRIIGILSEGGEVTMPPGETFWSPYFGGCDDKFGVGWMVSVPGEM